MADSTRSPVGRRLPGVLARLHAQRGVIVPVAFVALLVVILVPLPPWLMDVMIALNISLAVVILLTTIYMAEPLDFSVFPSLLLGTTLLRLVLNIATTRLILTADAPSPEAASAAAGQVIMAFGNFVAGDSLFVGIVIFLILVLVQFLVVTKGATRISEVAARFTLDAMPGKQMAIDSDLNAGAINEAEARRRRELIRREADFFGAMDGASKFVRGDAIAGLIITAVNIIGGLAVGLVERGWPLGQTADTFTRLTIGDGLTAQIPSFVISIAAALIVTRSGAKDELGNELTTQLVSQPKGLVITAGFLLLLAATPLPTIPLLATSAAIGSMAWLLRRRAREAAASGAGGGQAQERSPSARPEQAPPEEYLRLDTLELEVGVGLVELIDPARGGTVLERIAGIRRQFAAELGIVMPPIRIRDNMQMDANEYRLKIRGAVVAVGQLRPRLLLAIDPGVATGQIQGERTREPAFGLEACWIDPALRTRAETMNYSVIEPANVLGTHITEVVRQHAAELLSREEVTHLVEQLKQKAPKLVEETIPAVIKPADLQRVLQNLLRERVPVRDLETILEALGEWGAKTKDTDVLTEYARHALRRTICQQVTRGHEEGRPSVACVTLDPALEDVIAAHIDRSGGSSSVSMPARTATAVVTRISQALGQLSAAGHDPVVVASPQVRAAVRQLLEPHVPRVVVLGYNEIVQGIEVESVALASPPDSGARSSPAAA